MAKAIMVCWSEPTTKKCEKECQYYKGGDTKKCIPRMTEDAATDITDLLARAEAAEKEAEWLKKCVELAQRKEAEAEDRAKKAERDRDAAVKWIKEFTESIDRPCVACKHDTGDYVSLGVCGGCSKENSKWEWKEKDE